MENGGHFRRHLGFPRLHKGDTRGLLVCDSVHVPASILKKSACYQLCPGFGVFLANALGLIDLGFETEGAHQYQDYETAWIFNVMFCSLSMHNYIYSM